RLAWREAVMLPGLHRGSRPEMAAETSCELLAGIGGHDLRWETAPDKRRQFVHLVLAGEPLWLARHAGMGLVDDFAVATERENSASPRVRIRRCRDQSHTEAPAGLARKRPKKSAAPFSGPERPSRVVRHPAR